MENCLAIIPARGGSKRIPRKNIRAFLGAPIIKYSIDAAFLSGCFDEVMVSTEDIEISNTARSLGANIPFLRSPEAANDFATTADVLVEVLNEYNKIGRKFQYCCCIYPTAPFVSAQKLQDAFNLLKSTDADSVIPVVKFSYPILRAFKIEDQFLSMIWPEHKNTRSQDLPVAYHDCGQFYFFDVDLFLKSKQLFTDRSLSFVISETEVHDIDTEEDWKIAELKYSLYLRQ